MKINEKAAEEGKKEEQRKHKKLEKGGEKYTNK
jgi:hypothetical protein